jgi:hypothetical protein
VEAVGAQPENKRRRGSGEVAIEYIGRLYGIEKKAKELGLSETELYRIRQDEVKPLLEEFITDVPGEKGRKNAITI